MGFAAYDIPRIVFSRHELFILKYAQEAKPIPADETTVDGLVDDGFINRTSRENLFSLAENGRLACLMMRREIEALEAR